MNQFAIGQRVELKTCTNFPGTVKRYVRGRVAVVFDDFRNDAPKTFREESLQHTDAETFAENQLERSSSRRTS